MHFERELSLAIKAAKEAGKLLLSRQRAIKSITMKADDSPVTDVDRASEELIRNALLSEFNDDGFLGEESGSIAGTSGRTWIVDPLDGTRPYIHRLPTFSVLVALEVDNDMVVGVVHLPALQETYWASRGSGAFCNSRAIAASSTPTIDTAMGSCLGLVESLDLPEGKKAIQLIRKWDYSYGFMDAYSYMCVAAGRLDVCIGLVDSSWDRAAAACIISESGGEYSDFSGNKTVYNNTFIVSNGLLHDTLIAQLK